MGNLSSVPDASFENIDPGNKIQILPEKPSGVFLISFTNAFELTQVLSLFLMLLCYFCIRNI